MTVTAFQTCERVHSRRECMHALFLFFHSEICVSVTDISQVCSSRKFFFSSTPRAQEECDSVNCERASRRRCSPRVCLQYIEGRDHYKSKLSGLEGDPAMMGPNPQVYPEIGRVSRVGGKSRRALLGVALPAPRATHLKVFSKTAMERAMFT